MPIRITCQHCGKAFSAWDDLIGKSVQCPKCQQSMIVQATAGEPSAPAPRARQDRDAGKSAGRASPKPVSPKPATRQPVAPKTGSPKNKSVSPQSVPPKPPAVKPRVPAPPSAALPSKPTSSSEIDDFDDRDDLPFGCPKCNAEMEPNDDLCNACGYHLILKKTIDMEGVHRPDASTGFERVVKGQLDDGESTAGLLLWAKLGGLFFLVLVCFVCLGQWGLLIGALLVVGYLIYRARLKVKAEDNPGMPVEADPIATLLWSGMLAIQRVIGWRALEPPFGNLRVLTLRDGAFSNDDLGQVEDLKDFQVLDLEGTGITDAGLRHLKGRKQLRFLVVKNTAVTAAGVERLQPSVPAAWIWR